MIQATQHELIEKLAELQQSHPTSGSANCWPTSVSSSRTRPISRFGTSRTPPSSESSRSTVPTCSGANRPEPNVAISGPA